MYWGEYLKKMIHAVTLGFQIMAVIRSGRDDNGFATCDFQSIAVQSHEFLRVVGAQPNGFDAEIQENFRTQAVFAKVWREAQAGVGVHGIQSAFLQMVGMKFVGQADSTSFLTHIDKHATLGGGDAFQRSGQLLATVASMGMKDIASEAFAVDAAQNLLFSSHISMD